MNKKSALSFVLYINAFYFVTIGILSLLSPAMLTYLVGRGDEPSCYLWVRYIGAAAVPFGLAITLAARFPSANIEILQAYLILFISEVPLDIFLIQTGVLSFGQIGADIIILSITAVSIILLYPNYRELFRIRRGLAEEAALPFRGLRITLIVLFLYLFFSWVCLVFMPEFVNDTLHYKLAKSCLAWVQLNGPVGLAVGALFVLALNRLPQMFSTIVMVGLLGCALELILDAVTLWRGQLHPLQLSLDIAILATALAMFACSAIRTRKLVATPKP